MIAPLRVKIRVHEEEAPLTRWRRWAAPGEEVIQGTLPEGLPLHDPAVRDLLERWPGARFSRKTRAGMELTLVRRTAPARPPRWWLHAALLLLTVLSTTVAGAALRTTRPLRSPGPGGGVLSVPLAGEMFPGDVAAGLLYALPLLLILFCHEMGHYGVARWYRMDVSPPYFIPSPPSINLAGTFGAFIRLRSVVVNRVMLLDVGMAGPLASFFLSLPAVALGMAWSRIVPLPVEHAPAAFVVFVGADPVWLGGSLALDAMAALVVPGGNVVALHPVAFAGWLGLLVTTLNLFPLAQLDGGHILYALVGSAQRWIGAVFLLLLVLLGSPWWGGWWGWWLWAGLILVIGRGRIRHPAVLDPDFPVTGPRRAAGWLCALIFVLTFVPVPLRG